MAASGITEDYRCGYCYNDFNSMTDPRELPCHHVFCMDCLEGDCGDGGGVTCPICQAVYETPDFEELPKVTVEYGSESLIASTNFVCDKPCCEKPAVSYCGKCDEKICDIHKQVHEVYFEQQHTLISIDIYGNSQGKLKQPKCIQHNTILGQACKTCDKLICINCQIYEESCKERSQHSFCLFSELEDDVASQYATLQRKVAEKLTEACKLQKQTWLSLDAEEIACEEMLGSIDEICDEQIEFIKEEAKNLKIKVKKHQTDITEMVESVDTQLLEKKSELEELRRRLHKLLRCGHITEKIAQKQELTKDTELNLDLIDTNVTHCDLISEEGSKLGIDLVTIPHSVNLIREHDMESSSYSACFEKDGSILVGTLDGVRLLEVNGNLTRQATDIFQAHSVIKSGGNFIVLHRKSHGKGFKYTVEVCLPELTKRQVLFEFEQSKNMASRLAASGRYVMATNEDTNELIMHDLSKKVTSTVQQPIQRIKGMTFLSKSQEILVCDGNNLAKYKIEDGELREIWKRSGLVGGFRPCSGLDELIFVCSWTTKMIYVVSPDGQILKEITHPKLPTSPGFISISGNELAVPGWDDNKLYLFKIEK